MLTDELEELQGQGRALSGVKEHTGISHHCTGCETVWLPAVGCSRSRGPAGGRHLSHPRVRRIQNGRNLHHTIRGCSYFVCCWFVWHKSYLRGILAAEGGRDVSCEGFAFSWLRVCYECLPLSSQWILSEQFIYSAESTEAFFMSGMLIQFYESSLHIWAMETRLFYVKDTAFYAYFYLYFQPSC